MSALNAIACKSNCSLMCSSKESGTPAGTTIPSLFSTEPVDVPESREAIREELGIPESAVVATLVATMRPEKRVADFVTAVRQARESGVRRLVYLSSAHVFGFNREGRISERTRPRPEHPYGRALAADEAWLRSRYEPEVVVLRPAQGCSV